MANAIATVDETHKQKKEGEERSWSDLLPELLGLIQSRLFAGDYCTFRAVCKSWQSITLPLLMPIHDSPPFGSPCLMFLNKKNCLFNFFDPIRNATYQVDIPELVDANIRCSKDGWLLMCQGTETVFFFNPFSKEKIKLPDIPICYAFTTMCFSTPPTSSDCQVFGIESIGYDTVSIGTLKVGDESWTINLFDNNREFMVAKCNPVVCNGLFYCLGWTGNIGILDLKEHESSWTTCGKPKQLIGKSQQNFLIESAGDLLAVVVNRDGRQVDVLKLDLKKAAWHEVQSLGDKMMYVCHFGSFSEKAVVRGTSNKVYFPKFYGSNGVFYSLATRKFHSFVGNYSRKDFYGTKEMKHCTWITHC